MITLEDFKNNNLKINLYSSRSKKIIFLHKNIILKKIIYIYIIDI